MAVTNNTTTMNTELRDSVIAAVCNAFREVTERQVTGDDVLGRVRTKDIAVCRRLCMMIYRRHYLKSVEESGMQFNRNHATVTYSDKTGLWDIRFDPTTAQTYAMAMDTLGLKVPHWIKVCDYKKPKDKVFTSLKEANKFKRVNRKINGRIIFVRDGVCWNVTSGWAKRRAVESLQVDDGEYVKPMEWTAEERRKLKELRDLGLTEVR